MMNIDRVHEFIRELECERDRYDHAARTLRDMLSWIDGVPPEGKPADAEPKRPGTDKREPRPAPVPKRSDKVAPRKEGKEVAKPSPPSARKPDAATPAKCPSNKTGERLIDRIVAQLKRHGGPMTVADLALAAKCSADQAAKTLSYFRQQGLVERTKLGVYGLPGGTGKTADAVPSVEAAFNPFHHVEKHGKVYLCMRCEEARAEMADFEAFMCRGSV